MKNIEQAIRDIVAGDYFYETVYLMRYDLTSEDGCSKQSGVFLNDISIENRERGRTIIFETEIVDVGIKEKLPTPKCTGALITSNYGSPAWNLSLNGPIIIGNAQQLLLDIKESPVKPDKYVISGSSKINIKLLCDCTANIDREILNLEKNSTLQIYIDRNIYINFIKTIHTRESLMDKLLRYNKYQYSQIGSK